MTRAAGVGRAGPAGSPAAPAGASYPARLARYGAASSALALLSDQRLGRLVAGAAQVGTGIGGTAVLLEVAGTPVFAKRVPLTDLEQRPEHVRSTANLFGLPTFCQYGVGGPGFGAWRELAANTMTTNWVLERRCPNFPLRYHWRVLPGPAAQVPLSEEYADLAATVAHWHGSPAVRQRLEAVTASPASLVLFLEYLPHNLHDWLLAARAEGDAALAAGVAMVERELRTGVSVMNAGGLLHFDAHFRNILTDGHRLYLADLGLASSPRFELSPAESAFLSANRSHDGCYAVTQLVNWLVTALTGPAGPAERNAYLAGCAAGAAPTGVPAWAAEIISRYAPVAVVMNAFYWQLFGHSRMTPYPAEEIAAVCARTGFEPILPGPALPAR